MGNPEEKAKKKTTEGTQKGSKEGTRSEKKAQKEHKKQLRAPEAQKEQEEAVGNFGEASSDTGSSMALDECQAACRMCQRHLRI